MTRNKVEEAGIFLELYVGLMLLVLVAFMVLSGMVKHRQDLLIVILTFINASTGLFAGILARKEYWYGHITALGTALIILVAASLFGFNLEIMAWISCGNIGIGAILGIVGSHISTHGKAS